MIADVLAGGQSWALVCGDARAVLAEMPAESVTLICTSPPYNQGASPSAYEHPGSSRGQSFDWQGYGDDRDCLPEAEYQADQITSLVEMYRVLVPGGSLCYVHKDRTWDGVSISPRTWLEQSPFLLRQQIVWDRGSSHQHNGYYFPPSNEWIFWLTKGAPAQVPGNLAARWGSVWRIPVLGNSAAAAWHPAPFPLELAARCVAALSEPGDVVLDPYSGSSTTGLAALEANRRYLGVERNANYVELARARLQNYRRPLLFAGLKAQAAL